MSMQKLRNISKRQYSSQEDAMNAFIARLMQIYSNQSNMATSYVVALAAAQTFDIVKSTNAQSKNHQLFVWNYDKCYHTMLDEVTLNDWLSLAQQTLRIKTETFKLESAVLKQLIANYGVISREIEQYAESPDHYIAFEDCVIDSKTGLAVPKADDYYHFLSRLPHRFDVEIDSIHREMVERAMSDWSENDKDKEQFLWNYCRCVIEGNNKGRFLVIYAEGGNGKSTFINLLSNVVGVDKVFPLNLDQMENDFMLEGLLPSTHLISGDDLSKEFLVKDTTAAKLKSFTGDGYVRLNRKMKTPISMRVKAAIIQATNTRVRLSELNSAFKSRAILFNWTSRDFRSALRNNDIEFDLKSAINDSSFIETFIKLVFEKTEYSQELHVPKSLEEATLEQIESGDNFLNYVKYLDSEYYFSSNRIIHSSALYEIYKVWLKSENPSAKPMGKRLFSNRMTPIMENKGFHFCDELLSMTRTSFADENRVQLAALLELSDIDQIKSMKHLNRASYYVNQKQALNKEDEVEFDESASRLEQVNQMRRIVSKCYDDKDTVVMSQYAEIIKVFY